MHGPHLQKQAGFVQQSAWAQRSKCHSSRSGCGLEWSLLSQGQRLGRDFQPVILRATVPTHSRAPSCGMQTRQVTGEVYLVADQQSRVLSTGHALW
jgi:hypothetical protein